MESECPHCQAPLQLLEHLSWQTCEQCRRRLDVQAQLVYARARASFLAGQDAWAAVPTSRDRDTIRSLEARATLAYQQALSSLEVALGLNLTEGQRCGAIEMMMEISRELSRRGMLAPVVASYWRLVLVELNAQRECEDLDLKLSDPARRAIPGLPLRWRWQLRRLQLARALARLDRQIGQLEQAIAFADPPRARRPSR